MAAVREKDARGRTQLFSGERIWKRRLSRDGRGPKGRFVIPAEPPFVPHCAICAGTHPYTCETFPGPA